MLSNSIKSVLKSCGFIVTRLRKSKITGIDLDHDIKELIHESQPIILDIGANSGQSIQLFKRIWPASTIHSFEPTSSLANKLLERFQDDHTFINATAMGALTAKATLLVNPKSVLNSSDENRFREKK